MVRNIQMGWSSFEETRTPLRFLEGQHNGRRIRGRQLIRVGCWRRKPLDREK